MSSQPLDPNRFASGFEAQSVRARSQIEQAEVELAHKRQSLARETYSAAEQRFIEAEAAYMQCKAEKEDAFSYLARADSHLDASIGRLAETNAPLHPVRKTPLEVLGTIFELCLEYLPETVPISEQQSDIRKRQLQPFYLAAVCRRWRSASLAWPRAWAAFDFKLDDVSRFNVTRWKDFLSNCLARSSTRPLDIRIIRRLPNAGPVTGLIPLLAGALGRCQSLLVSAPGLSESGDILEPILTAATPSLSYLHFLIPRESVLADTSRLFPHAPKLLNIRTQVPSLLDRATFPNLVGVVLCSPCLTLDGDDFGALIGKHPQLTLLSLVNPRFEDVGAHERIKLGVQVLRVSQHTSDGHVDALARIYSFPNLSMLSLWGPLQASESYAHLLLELAPVAPLLRHLSIENVASLALSQILVALRGHPRLGILHIKTTTIDSAGLADLCSALAQPLIRADGEATWFCPCLQHLKLKSCTLAPECAQEKFVEAIERRLRASAVVEGARPPRPRPLRIVELPLGVDAEINARVSELLASK